MDLKLIVDEMGNPSQWSLRVKSILTAILVGPICIIFRGPIYDTFWHYFWGPIIADATGSACVVKNASPASWKTTFPYGYELVRGFEFIRYGDTCAKIEGIVAYPGYTYVSEIGYGILLVVILFAVSKMLSHTGVKLDKKLVFSLIPYMVFGGALRVVEDANDIVPVGIESLIEYPVNILLISPVIYGTMFLVTIVSILVSIKLEEKKFIDRYEHALIAIGIALAVAVLSYLGWLILSWAHVHLYLEIALVVLTMTTVFTIISWWFINRDGNTIAEGIGSIGIVVLWSQILDGVANVVGIDWVYKLTGGMQKNLVPKHPINRGLVEIGSQFPEWVTNIIGTAWLFLVVKIGAALLVIYIFDKEAMEENPGWTILLLIVIIAVGLGPGMRDMLRAVLGI